jgi:hypothetical protein
MIPGIGRYGKKNAIKQVPIRAFVGRTIHYGLVSYPAIGCAQNVVKNRRNSHNGFNHKKYDKKHYQS